MAKQFNSGNVERRTFSGFAPRELDLELLKTSIRTTQAGDPAITVTFMVPDDGRPCARMRVLDSLYFTEKSFTVTVNKLQDMGFDMPVIKGTPLSCARQIKAFLDGNIQHTVRGFVAVDENNADIKSVRFYIEEPRKG